MIDGVLFAALLLGWGIQAVAPWRLAGMEPERRRLWVLMLLPLLVVGALAAVQLAQTHPDAAVSQRLYPLLASKPGRALAILFPALALSDIVLAAGWSRLEPAGWRIASGFGLAFLLAASWAGELLRTGEGPESATGPLIALVILRALLSLGVAEALAPGRPLLATVAGLTLPLYLLLLPGPLAQALIRRNHWLTLAAAALLLLAARWLPARLRRPSLLAAALLAGLFLGEAGNLSQGLAPPPVETVPAE
ncbi:MAG: hypothetical protein ACJ75H_12385 [Thermoanaerobaculia bacterium]